MAAPGRSSADEHSGHQWEIQSPNAALVHFDLTCAHCRGNCPREAGVQERTTPLGQFLVRRSRRIPERRPDDYRVDVTAVSTVAPVEAFQLPPYSVTLPRLVVRRDRKGGRLASAQLAREAGG